MANSLYTTKIFYSTGTNQIDGADFRPEGRLSPAAQVDPDQQIAFWIVKFLAVSRTGLAADSENLGKNFLSPIIRLVSIFKVRRDITGAKS